MVKKDTTRWIKEVKTVKEQKKWYLALEKCKNEENVANYKRIKNKTKVVVCEADLKVFEEVFDQFQKREKISIGWQKGDMQKLMI